MTARKLPGAAAIRKRVQELCATLPRVKAEQKGAHVGFSTGSRRFAWFLENHHGDGRVSLCVKAVPDRKEMLIATLPERYFNPPYLGHQGWLGIHLDVAPVDWDDVAALLAESHALASAR